MFGKQLMLALPPFSLILAKRALNTGRVLLYPVAFVKTPTT